MTLNEYAVIYDDMELWISQLEAELGQERLEALHRRVHPELWDAPASRPSAVCLDLAEA